MRKMRLFAILCTGMLPAIIPTTCARPILRELTPFLIDGSSQLMRDIIFLAAPLVLP